MSYVIGVTGGVGVGKSQVLSLLKDKFGAEVILADEVGRQVMEPDGCCFRPVSELFGSRSVKADGTLDRPWIASQVFCDRELLKKLNGIIHPAVKREIIRQCEASEARLIAVEAALLLEAHYEDVCDEFWYIYANEETRRRRLRESRGYSDERIDSMMANQLSEEAFRAGCQRVIDNSGALADTEAQIRKLLRKLGLA
ncbi:MAG: dephospho-CoA kinase [Lachnospiraceae bacterium]|nr:dephospho-CoA kinase [Lachnospiraceae bacterium]